jgi:hypothetical protein
MNFQRRGAFPERINVRQEFFFPSPHHHFVWSEDTHSAPVAGRCDDPRDESCDRSFPKPDVVG